MHDNNDEKKRGDQGYEDTKGSDNEVVEGERGGISDKKNEGKDEDEKIKPLNKLAILYGRCAANR